MGTRLPGFCLNRTRPHVRVRSPPIQAKPNLNSTKNDQNKENPDSVAGDKEKSGNPEGKAVELLGRKIMVVVDSSIEAKGALQWALSHNVQSQDLLILLHVTKASSKQGWSAWCYYLFFSEKNLLRHGIIRCTSRQLK